MARCGCRAAANAVSLVGRRTRTIRRVSRGTRAGRARRPAEDRQASRTLARSPARFSARLIDRQRKAAFFAKLRKVGGDAVCRRVAKIGVQVAIDTQHDLCTRTGAPLDGLQDLALSRIAMRDVLVNQPIGILYDWAVSG